ncbi:response regulator, partial [Erysipelatoclostridium ramosum]
DDHLDSAQLVKEDIQNLYPDLFAITIMNDEQIKKDILTVQYDLYILDIEMPAISGFDVAKILHNRQEEALIVFLTTHQEL